MGTRGISGERVRQVHRRTRAGALAKRVQRGEDPGRDSNRVNHLWTSGGVRYGTDLNARDHGRVLDDADLITRPHFEMASSGGYFVFIKSGLLESSAQPHQILRMTRYDGVQTVLPVCTH